MGIVICIGIGIGIVIGAVGVILIYKNNKKKIDNVVEAAKKKP